MNDLEYPARSALYRLEPIGVATPETESLLSYFCRLAVVHCLSVTDLRREISQQTGWGPPPKHFWKQINFNGMGEAAEQYSSKLSHLTSVKRLDNLTMRPWRNVVAQKTRVAMSSRWCAECLADDRSQSRTPYFRLAWDVGDVDVCAKHGTPLVDVCPECGHTDARNGATCVIPGWCCYCGAYLGEAKETSAPGSRAARWKAAQIGDLIAAHASIVSPAERAPMTDGILKLVDKLDGGKYALFARRIGLNKSTVHYWLREGGAPTVEAHLRIASQTGVPLVALLTANIGHTDNHAAESLSLAELFPESKKRPSPRVLDHENIGAQLDALNESVEPVSVREAARRLKIHPRQLYLAQNEKTRALGARWKCHLSQRSEANRRRAGDAIAGAVKDLLAEGKSANLRQVQTRVTPEVLGSVRNVVGMIKEVKASLDVE